MSAARALLKVLPNALRACDPFDLAIDAPGRLESEGRIVVQRNFDVLVEKDEEGYYVASVPALPGCHTQAKSLDELDRRIREAIELCLEVEGVPGNNLE